MPKISALSAASTLDGTETLPVVQGGSTVKATGAQVKTLALNGFSANGLSLGAAADYTAMKVLLSLTIGTNVQAYSASLAALAALSTTDKFYYLSAASTWTAVTVGTGLSFTTGTLAATGFAGSGAITGSGLTMATARLLGRTTASTGAVEEISVGAGLSFAAGALAVDQTALKPTEHMVIAVGDEATAITTGTGKVTFRMPYAFTVTEVRASCNTAPTGSTILIDINEAGTTILSTKLMIDASEKTSTTAATAAVLSDSSIADDAEISIDFDQVGSTIAGAGVKVTIIGRRT